jgi:DNA polymerase-3 subunit epsilon
MSNNESSKLRKAMLLLKDNGYENYNVLFKVPTYTPGPITGHGGEIKKVAIIDLETTGLDYRKDKITEIGIVVADMYPGGTLLTQHIYQSFNDPGVSISAKITELTGITDEMVKGQSIDWAKVYEIVGDVDLFICHNAAFDRKFLEQIWDKNCVFKTGVFACTKNDIDWSRRGYGASKLDYLNWKLGFYYDAHRAINDCWATLNLLVQEDGAFQELLDSTKDQYEVYAIGAAYHKKDELKENGFYWNDGSNGKPKAWFNISIDELEATALASWIEARKLGVAKIITIPVNRKYSSVK